MPKIKFKKGPKATGLSRIVDPYPTTDIKINKQTIGHIAWDRYNNHWQVSIAFKREKTPENPCSFYWVRFDEKFTDEASARKFIKEKSKEILSWDLHQFDF